MTDAEISRQLALAIGWRDDRITKDGWPDPDVVVFDDYLEKGSWCGVWFSGDWKKFDYRDHSVIWPIAERFDAFPRELCESSGWFARVSGAGFGCSADTAAKAVALAVIKAKEQK